MGLMLVSGQGGGTVGMEDARFQQVRGYWEGLRRNGALPRRPDIDPRGMEAALSHVLLAERVAPGLARLRIAGMHLADLMGMEVRGMPLSALFEPMARARLAGILEQVWTRPAIADLRLEAGRSPMQPALSARLLLLPVAAQDGATSRLLGCLVSQGTVGRAPRRFGIAGADVAILHDVPAAVAPPAPPARRNPARPAAAQPGLAEPAAPFAGPADPAAPRERTARPGRPPYLRLVQNRD